MGDVSRRICYLISVYNDQKGIVQSLQSVFDDDPLADVLVVDDGSDPACILPPQPDGFCITLIRLDRNMGLVAALNAGLERILIKPYDYVARLDAGDTVNRGRLMVQMEYLDAHPDVGLLGTQILAFDQATGRPLFEFNNPEDPATIRNSLKIRNCIAHPSAMIRAGVFRAAGSYDPAYKFAEDYEMWRRIIRTYAAANLPTVYVNKAITPVQMTAVYRSHLSFFVLKAQLQYFELSDPWCWVGVGRTIVALFIPRWLLLGMRIMLARQPPVEG